MHHQNRLRHSDHLALFEAAGLHVVDVSIVRSDDDTDLVAASPLDARFASMAASDVAIRMAHVVLTRH